MFFNEYKNYVTDNGRTSMNPGLSFLGGMLSGCFSTLCNNPLDVIKTRMQGASVGCPPSPSLDPNQTKTLGATHTSPPRPPLPTHSTGLDAAKYSSALDCFRQILAHEGPKTFLRGLVPRLGRVVPGQGIIFMSFESIQNFLVDKFL